MTKSFIGIVALATNLSVAAESPNITGTWNMGLEGDHVIPVALVLKQDGHKLTGTIALPTQNAGDRVEVRLSGEFADGAFKLSGTVEGAKEPTTLAISGKLLDDGSMEGKFEMPGHGHGSMSWTAERLKERK
jgi:hypothetical protein